MKEQNLEHAIEFLKNALQNIVDGKVIMDKLTITKSLRSNYKKPDQIAHKVLADRISKRDPGNKPSSGDRIKYAYIMTDKPKALQGDKIETPEFILENELKLNYGHYITNQIMKPVQQVFSLALYDMPDFKKKMLKVNKFRKQEDEIRKEYDLEIANKKLETLRNKEVKVLLFDKYLKQINNVSETNILSFFG